LKIKQKIKK